MGRCSLLLWQHWNWAIIIKAKECNDVCEDHSALVLVEGTFVNSLKTVAKNKTTTKKEL